MVGGQAAVMLLPAQLGGFQRNPKPTVTMFWGPQKEPSCRALGTHTFSLYRPPYPGVTPRPVPRVRWEAALAQQRGFTAQREGL